jgi:hypothetical protein
VRPQVAGGETAFHMECSLRIYGLSSHRELKMFGSPAWGLCEVLEILGVKTGLVMEQIDTCVLNLD